MTLPTSYVDFLMPNTEDALVEAVARAICDTPDEYPDEHGCYDFPIGDWRAWAPEARAAISAARPLIERALLEEIGDKIVEKCGPPELFDVIDDVAKARNIDLSDGEW